MSVRTKVGLGFNNYIRENELGWDDSAFSVFTANSEDVEGRPLFNSDKSSEVNTNDFASSDSSVKSSEAKPNNSTSCASTSSISTSENEAEIESNVGTPIQEPIIVQDLPNFSCNSSDKNENTSTTSCNKNGYFNKKAGHFRKNASSISKLCFVCGSGTHFIKDCNFYEKQMVNKTVGIEVGPVHSRNKVNHQNQFVPQAVLLRTGKVNIPPARPQPVPTGKPKAFAPVPTGRQNRPFPVPTNRGYSLSVITDGQLRLSPQQVVLGNHIEKENPFPDAEDEKVFDSGCSRSMTGRITGKGTIRTLTLDFENVYYVKELQHFNLFSISEICNKKNRVLFTDTECLVLSKDFKLPDESMVVKAMRCDNGTEFKNDHIIELCGSKGIKRKYSNARTLQQNEVAERKNQTLIEAARTMLADSKLPTMFWTQAVRTACYVLNRVLVTSPHNKTPYALLTGNIPSVSHFKPFGCHVTILNTSDHLGKFDRKADEGYILDILQVIKPTRCYKHVQANQSAGTQDTTTNPAGRINLRRTSVTGFPAQSIRSSEAITTDSPYLLVLNTGASQSRQHGKE
nr:hypothetical protein [Tanacetum cinerariifolium]